MVDSATTAVAEDGIAVRCLILRLQGMTLLLPNTVIAEVTESQKPDIVENAPDWFQGFLSWRGRTIPRVSLEQLLNLGEVLHTSAERMVILNTLNGNSRLPFVAMPIQGLPRALTIKGEMLEYDESSTENESAIKATILLEGESVVIPNLDAIEGMLENLGVAG